MQSDGFIAACKTGDLRSGQMKAVQVGKTHIVVAHLGDTFYAFAYYCPHMRWPLSVGTLNPETCTIRCALHHSEFDLRDGHVVHWSPRVVTMGPLLGLVVTPHPLPTYPVRIEDDRVLVKVS